MRQVRRARARRPVLLAASLVVGLGTIGAVTAPFAAAVQASHATLVNTFPPTYTPNFDANDTGVVYSLEQVGSTIVAGGRFSTIAPHSGGTSTAVTNVAAFTAGTGAIVTGFRPTVDGDVFSVAAGPTAGTVYVAGQFRTIDGVSSHIALVSTTTGAIVSGWKSPNVDGAINDVQLADGQLFIGGYFTYVGGQPRNGFASLNPTTGAVTSFSTLAFTGHHNYAVNCTSGSCANGAVGVKAMDVTPDGTRMMVLGNFRDVSGTARDQAVMLDLGSHAVIDQDWRTEAFTSPCKAASFDFYVRDVQFSPDGSYFAVVATGAGGPTQVNTDGTRALCDAVARFETDDTGTDVQPTWGDWTGNDSLWSVAVTGAAIYVGGHQRWLNNSVASDSAQAGAVPRPGVAAVDPQNGVPLAWNPGRNPRGAGAYALLATPTGLYVGSDTDYVGNFQYFRAKLAFFPLAGGETLPHNAIGSLPGDVYLFSPSAGVSTIKPLAWNGVSPPSPAPSITSFNAQNVRGAFLVDGNVYYGATDGNFYKATFNGTAVGTPTAIDPYDDPFWSDVDTGSGTVKYRGYKSTFYPEIPSLTSMFYWQGRVYYTLAGNSHMFWRWFETDDGVMGSQRFTTTDTVDWSHVSGAFLSGGTIYYANSTNGNLMAVRFSGGQPSGSPTVAESTTNWSSRGAVVITDSQVPSDRPPVASFSVSCTTTDVPCAADAAASKDPDGSITSYKWDWGDGTTIQGASATASHSYAFGGSYTVTLTVTDDQGATGVASRQVDVTGVAAPAISFRAAATKDPAAAATSISVTAPNAIQSGDELLLFETFTSTTITTSAPPGWAQVGKTVGSNLTTVLYAKPAAATDSGSTISVSFSGSVKASLAVAAYANASNPVEVSASKTDTMTATHVAPTVTGLTAGSYAVTFWADKSTTTTAWTPPPGVTTRATAYGSSGGAISNLLVDSGGAVAGSYGGLAATTNVSSGSGAQWTVGLAVKG